MNSIFSTQDFQRIAAGYDAHPSRSMSLKAEAYTQPDWFALDQQAVIAKSWQWVCHVEKLREPGSYVTTRVAGHSIGSRST